MYAFAPVKRDQSPFDAFFASSQTHQKPDGNTDFGAVLAKSQETANPSPHPDARSDELNAKADAKKTERDTVERRSRDKETKDAKEVRDTKDAEKTDIRAVHAEKPDVNKAALANAVVAQTKKDTGTVRAERGVIRPDGKHIKKNAQEKKNEMPAVAEHAAAMQHMQPNSVKVQKKPVMESSRSIRADGKSAVQAAAVNKPGVTAAQAPKTEVNSVKMKIDAETKEAKAVHDAKNGRERTEKAKPKSDMPIARAENDKPTELTVIKQKDMSAPATAPVTDTKVNAQMKAESLQPVAKFQDILPQLVDRAQVMMSEGRSEITMTLKPEALGDVKMKFSLEGDRLVGDITVDSAAVKDIFDRNIDSVIQSLSDMNITVSQFSVSLKNDAEADYQAYEREFAKKSLSTDGDMPMNETQTASYALYGRTLDLVI